MILIDLSSLEGANTLVKAGLRELGEGERDDSVGRCKNGAMSLLSSIAACWSRVSCDIGFSSLKR